MSTLDVVRSGAGALPISVAPPPEPDGPRFARRAAAFVGIGLLIYLALYAASEWIVRQTAERNRFHAVNAAPHDRYDFVILGASHAAVFDYRDMNERLEALTQATILNLSTVGAGVLVNRLLLDYFHLHRHAEAVVYVLDSFAFYSPEWNEERLRDTRLYLRAPLDASLVRLLLADPAARVPGLTYLSGFPKINNRERFEPDRFAGEGAAFDRVYRPIAQIDRQRLQYLYPEAVSGERIRESPYLSAFEELAREVTDRGARFVVVRPPIPQRIYDAIPGEAEFDTVLRDVVERSGGEYHNLALVSNDPEYFYDSDHLNQDGVVRFFEDHLADVLLGRRDPNASHRAAGAAAIAR